MKLKLNLQFFLVVLFLAGFLVLGNFTRVRAAITQCSSVPPNTISYSSLSAGLTSKVNANIRDTGAICQVTADVYGTEIWAKKEVKWLGARVTDIYVLYKPVRSTTKSKNFSKNDNCTNSKCGGISSSDNVYIDAGENTYVESTIQYGKSITACCTGFNCAFDWGPVLEQTRNSMTLSQSKFGTSGVLKCDNVTSPSPSPTTTTQTPTPTPTGGGGGTSTPTTPGATTSTPGSTTTSNGGISTSTELLPEKPAKLPDVDVTALVNRIIQIIFAVGQIAFVIVFLIGGVMFITSVGNEQQAERSKKLLLYAIIGMVVLFAAWGIAEFIIGQLSSA